MHLPRTLKELLSDLERRQTSSDDELDDDSVSVRSVSSASSTESNATPVEQRVTRRHTRKTTSKTITSWTTVTTTPAVQTITAWTTTTKTPTQSIGGFLTILPSSSSSARRTTTASSTRSTATSSSVLSTSSSSVFSTSSLSATSSSSSSSFSTRTRGTTTTTSTTPLASASVISDLIPSSTSLSQTAVRATSTSASSQATATADSTSTNTTKGATAQADDNSGSQVGVVTGSIAGALVLVGLLAFFVFNKVKKAKAAKRERSSIPDFISRPLARSDSNPWQGPMRTVPAGAAAVTGAGTRPTTGTRATADAGAAAVAGAGVAQWPMGNDNNARNSMADGDNLDDKQYLAYRNLVGDAQDGQQQQPQQYQQQTQTQPPPDIRVTRWMDATIRHSYERADPTTQGRSLTGQWATPGQRQPPPPPRDNHLSTWPVVADTNDQRAPAEKQMLGPNYHVPGAEMEPVKPPSPLFFRYSRADNGSRPGGAVNQYISQQQRQP